MNVAEGILPAGWVGLTLEDAAEIHDNLREPVNSSERAKRPGSYPYYGATGQVGWIDDFRQDGEYVLLGEDGAPFFEPTKEKAYLVSGKCWVNNHAHVLKGREGLCSNRYLLYSLNQTNYRGYANGTTRLKLTQSAMRQLPINLAPPPEQHRIVAKIEELFSELDKGFENLKTARAQLKVYRQALLKHAFEGKLTAQWRAEHQGKLETADALLKRIQQERAQRHQQQLSDWEAADKQGSKPKAPKPLPPLTAAELAELPELPEGWGWLRVQELADKVTDGEHITPRRTESGYYLLSARNIQNGYLDLSNVDYVPKDEFERIRKRCNPEEGDILISCSGSIGRICRVPKNLDFVMVRSVAVVKLQDSVESSKFYEYLFQSPLLQRQIEKGKKATAQANLFLDPINNLKILVCSKEEQMMIIGEIEARLSEVDQLELTITTSLQQAETLRQSILKRAFSGQLVPQDPHDEPASTLLARIKAGRETVAAKPRKTGKGKA